MALFLAIDAGGTKAEYVLADESTELARVTGGTIKRMRTTAEIAEDNLASALASLEVAAGVDLSQVTRTCIGTAGNTVPLVTNWLRKELGSRVGGELLLLGDVEIALDAAFPGQAGVLVLAGTGSNIAGRTAQGVLLGAGGHGPILADQGSGHQIGLQALRATFFALDEQRTTALLPAILAHWSLQTVADLVSYANTCPQQEFSALSHLVSACAEAGDAVARDVLTQQADALAHLALLVSGRITTADGPDWQPCYAFAGSILQHVPILRDRLVARLLAANENAVILKDAVSPVAGALWRARQSHPSST